MIHGPEKFYLPTVSKDKVEMIVNWNKASNDCEFVKMRINGKKEIVIPKCVLIRTAMFLGNEEEQEALIPTKNVTIRQYKKKMTIRLLKDMREGESLTIPVSFDIPLNEDTFPILELTDKYF